MFASLAIIILATSHASDALHNVRWGSRQHPNKTILLSEKSFYNESVYYAAWDQASKQCSVVCMTNVDQSCNLNLKVDDVQKIVAFGKDKAILVTVESPMLKLTTVNTSDCKTVDAKLPELTPEWESGNPLYLYFMSIVTFDDGFELIVTGLSEICSKPHEKKYCAFKFDAEGKRTEGPYVWPRIEYESIDVASPIIADAAGKGYIFIHQNGSSHIGVQVDRVGGPTHVKLWGPYEADSKHVRGAMSAANNANGVCYAFNSTIKCWQNDAEGGLSMRTELTFKHEQEIRNIYVHNLPNGGFLVLMITCPNQVCSGGPDDHYYMLKIDAQGKTMSHVEIKMTHSKCNASNNGVIMANVYVNEKRRYCSNRLCHNNIKGEAALEFIENCYTEDEFMN